VSSDTGVLLRYRDCVLAVRAPDGLAEDVAARLAPFVSSVEQTSGTVRSGRPRALDGPQVAAEVLVTVGRIPDDRLQEVRRHGDVVPIDVSLYPTNTDGRRLSSPGRVEVLVSATGTLCSFRSAANEIRLRAPDLAAARIDLPRVVKNLFTSWGERQGGLFLHASAVVVDGRATMISADSRNGKTSLLLELLTRTRCTMLSCDTVLVRLGDGTPVITGWPSNFSVSVGSVYDVPPLVPLLDNRFQGLSYSQAWDHYPKEVLDTPVVLDRLHSEIEVEAPLESAVFAFFDPRAATGLSPVSDESAVLHWLDAVTLGSRDPLYPNWLGFWTTPEDELTARMKRLAGDLVERLPVYRLDWAPGPLQLLRHIPSVDRAFRGTATPDETR
jgi:hypothetical protein